MNLTVRAVGRQSVASTEQLAEARSTPSGRSLAHQAFERIKDQRVSLSFLGEDDSGDCKALVRNGPVAKLSAEAALRVLGFDVAKQLASDDFSFDPVRPGSPFWADFVAYNSRCGNGDAARLVKSVLLTSDVVEMATLIAHDDVPFSAPAFLIARMKDGSIVALRGPIGGMTL